MPGRKITKRENLFFFYLQMNTGGARKGENMG